MSCRRIELAGKKLGRLLVVRETSKNRAGQISWECKCDCGRVVNVSTAHLNRKTAPVRSCGCRVKKGKDHPNWNGAGQISGGWWYDHVLRERDQKVRERVPVTIDAEYAWNLFQKQRGICALSGVPIHISGTQSLNTASLDRIDSSKGYEPGNVQWVHKHLNFMKRTYSQDYFIEMCGSVYLKHRGHNG